MSLPNHYSDENYLTSTSFPVYRTPNLFSSIRGLIAAESTRHGGVSPAPYASLNLGISTADTPEHIAENRTRFWNALGVDPVQVVTSHQVHGFEILTATRSGRYEGYDALITNCSGLILAVTVADCTPILVYDPEHRALAAIHAGWRGTVQEIALKTIQKMQQEYGTNPAECYAYVGTCIDECSFEVGDEVAAQFAQPHKRFDDEAGKYFVDLKKANQDQLLAAGLRPARIEVSAFSTVKDNDDYFSYRLEQGKTGRMLACIGMV